MEFSTERRITVPSNNEGIKAVGALYSSVCKVMGEIERLDKLSENTHSGYSFASVDDFFSALNKKMAEAGLSVIQDEVDWQVKEIKITRSSSEYTRSLLFITFDFHLNHISGASVSARRTVNVQLGGAQEWGQAQSYALKQFLRSIFLVATGEPDADQNESLTVPDKPTHYSTKESKKYADESIESLKSAPTVEWLEEEFSSFRDSKTGQMLLNKDKKRVLLAYEEQKATMMELDLKEDTTANASE